MMTSNEKPSTTRGLLPSSMMHIMDKFKRLDEVVTPHPDDEANPASFETIIERHRNSTSTRSNSIQGGSGGSGNGIGILVVNDDELFANEGSNLEEFNNGDEVTRQDGDEEIMSQLDRPDPDARGSVNGVYLAIKRGQLLAGLSEYMREARRWLKRAERVCGQFVSLLRQDSFRFVRLALSIFILLFCLVFFLLTFVQDEDFYQNLFHVIKNYVFVNNPTNNLRAN